MVWYDRDMKKLLALLFLSPLALLIIFSPNGVADGDNRGPIILLCNGEKPADKNRTSVYVDCSDQESVTDVLSDARWMIYDAPDFNGKDIYLEMCRDSWSELRYLDPRGYMSLMGQSYLNKCNIGLSEI